jgi:hypothetical protein
MEHMADVPATRHLDDLGRPLLPNGAKEQLRAAFQAIPDGKRGALVVVANGAGGRAHVAAKINGTWKVAAGAGWDWTGKKPDAFFSIEGSW